MKSENRDSDDVAAPDSKSRFSDRVANYICYRPGYPSAILDVLVDKVGPGAAVADIGSGTGIFSGLLLDAGFTVYAVEPNDEMRAAAEGCLGARGGFTSVSGAAEATKLPNASVDLVAVAQAFHWFHRDAFRDECNRILRPGGVVALIWNDRRTDSTPFLEAYEYVLKTLGNDYAAVNHRNIGEGDLAAWFGGGMSIHAFENQQRFDWDGLYGRAMSSSYVPAIGDARHAAFAAGLRAAFDAHAVDGAVTFEYDTRMYAGALG